MFDTVRSTPYMWRETVRAIRIHTPGTTDVLTVDTVDEPTPGASEILVANEFAGVNFIDTYERSGRYPLSLPATLGKEGAGTVTATGDGVTGFSVGDRVAWAWGQGSYAEQVVVAADKAALIPDAIPTDIAAATMLQGMTAHYLITSVYEAKTGDVALVHAAAGGVGLVITQMLAKRGVTVIGTVSTEKKAEAATQAGATHIIRYDTEDVAQRVMDITDGAKCHVVYDGVGQATFEGSLQSLRPRGTLALFGAASGPVPPFDLQRLSPLGSLFVTRPTLGHFIQTAEEHQWRSGEIFDDIVSGALTITIGGRYALEDVATAHRDLESRATSGKLLLEI
jgi:NADPH:quinone reductase